MAGDRKIVFHFLTVAVQYLEVVPVYPIKANKIKYKKI